MGVVERDPIGDRSAYLSAEWSLWSLWSLSLWRRPERILGVAASFNSAKMTGQLSSGEAAPGDPLFPSFQVDMVHDGIRLTAQQASSPSANLLAFLTQRDAC